MGCDIHMCIEAFVDGEWVMYDRVHHSEKAKDRCYRRFDALCGVRGDSGKVPNGLPSDISKGAQIYVDEWGGDAHSHGYIGLSEIASIFRDVDNQTNEYALTFPIAYYFNLDVFPEEEDSFGKASDFRVIYFFDS